MTDIPAGYARFAIYITGGWPVTEIDTVPTINDVAASLSDLVKRTIIDMEPGEKFEMPYDKYIVTITRLKTVEPEDYRVVMIDVNSSKTLGYASNHDELRELYRVHADKEVIVYEQPITPTKENE